MEINGKRYDAHTGALLDHEHHVPIQAPKPVAAPVAAAVAHHKQHKQTVRQPAKSATRHKQQRSTTLMRRTVRKPGASSKHHIKAQGHTGTLAEQPAYEIVPKLSFGVPDDKRLHRASRVKKSDLISHFNPDQTAYQASYKVSVTVNPVAVAKSADTPKPAAKAVPRQPAPDIDDIFERAIQNATSHLEPSPKKAKKRRLHMSRKHSRA